jgi:hypothetical protein
MGDIVDHGFELELARVAAAPDRRRLDSQVRLRAFRHVHVTERLGSFHASPLSSVDP